MGLVVKELLKKKPFSSISSIQKKKKEKKKKPLIESGMCPSLLPDHTVFLWNILKNSLI